MSDRFEFEQEIMECWKITNDLQMYIDQGASIEDTKVLIDYYERKFQKVWDTFETLIKERKILWTIVKRLSKRPTNSSKIPHKNIFIECFAIKYLYGKHSTYPGWSSLHS